MGNLPFCYEPSILLMTFWGAVRANVVIPAVDRDNGTVSGLVESVRRGTIRAWHDDATSKIFQNGTCTVFLRTSLPHHPTQVGILNPGFSEIYGKLPD
jgi:hypothetical protein